MVGLLHRDGPPAALRPRHAALEWFAGPEFDRLLVDTVTSTFPLHEHDHLVVHYRGLLGAWVNDETQRLSAAA